MAWDQMLSIIEEAMQYVKEEKTQPPLACPNDGEPLTTSPDGGLFCKFDGYSWPKMRRII
jgi:hypothetical protein